MSDQLTTYRLRLTELRDEALDFVGTVEKALLETIQSSAECLLIKASNQYGSQIVSRETVAF